MTRKTSDGKQIVCQWPTQGSKALHITPNWCDPTTWYLRAARVVDEAVTPDAAFVVYSLAHDNAIDTHHGKLTGEDFLTDADGNSYRVAVTVNGIAKAERDPHVGSGGDYVVDYAAGTITFAAPLAPTDAVLVTYHYAGPSEWVLRPTLGKILMVKSVEVQFSNDLVLTDSVRYQAFGPVEIWAPHLTPVPFASGTMLPLGSPDVYKTVMDFVNEANGAYPQIVALGGGGWRGLPQPVSTFPWQYQSLTELPSSLGLEVRVWLEHDTPFGGTAATATFYCLSVNE